MRASQFFQQFHFVIRHKPGKVYIIPDRLSKLASANCAGYNNFYFKLDALFTYHATLVKITSNLIKQILNGYLANNW